MLFHLFLFFLAEWQCSALLQCMWGSPFQNPSRLSVLPPQYSIYLNFQIKSQYANHQINHTRGTPTIPIQKYGSKMSSSHVSIRSNPMVATLDVWIIIYKLITTEGVNADDCSDFKKMVTTMHWRTAVHHLLFISKLLQMVIFQTGIFQLWKLWGCKLAMYWNLEQRIQGHWFGEHNGHVPAINIKHGINWSTNGVGG